MQGILVINKESGWTSHDVVAKLRSKFNIKKVGHAGTLDPLAQGVLVVMLGKATKLSENLRGQDKEYVLTIEFGTKTKSGDAEGEVIEQLGLDHAKLRLTKPQLKRTLVQFMGEIEQVVPWYSAVKVKGRKLYQIARSLEKTTIKRPKRKIKIYDLKLISFCSGSKKHYPQAVVKLTCSSGTYTRSLAEDIGQALGIPAYQKGLVRTRVGRFSLDQAKKVNRIALSDIIK